MKHLMAILKREFALFFRNKIMVVLYLGGPILYGFVFHAVYSKGKVTDLPVVVVDKDQSALSTTLAQMIDDAEVTNISQVRYDETDARELLMGNAAYAVVIIPYRFQADILQKRHPEVLTYINNTNLLPAGYVNRSLALTTATFNTMLAPPGNGPSAGVKLNTFRLFNPSSNYALYIWPSYLAIVLQSVVMVVLALSFAGEHERGSLPILKNLSGGSVITVLAGKVLPYCCMAVFSLGAYTIYFFLFKQPLPEDLGATLLIIGLFLTTNCFLGALAGLAFKKQLACLQFLMVLSMPVYVSSGFSWPYDETGWLSRAYSLLFPYMGFVNAVRILLTEQGSLKDILPFVCIQAVQLALYALAGYAVLRRQLKQAI